MSLPSSLSSLNGEWHLERQENVEAFLKAAGIGLIKRTLAAKIKSASVKILITKQESKENDIDIVGDHYLFNITLKTPMFERERLHPLPCFDYSIDAMHGMPEDIVPAKLQSYFLSKSNRLKEDKIDLDEKEVLSIEDIIVQVWDNGKNITRNRIYLTKNGKLVMEGWRDDANIVMKRIFGKKQ